MCFSIKGDMLAYAASAWSLLFLINSKALSDVRMSASIDFKAVPTMFIFLTSFASLYLFTVLRDSSSFTLWFASLLKTACPPSKTARILLTFSALLLRLRDFLLCPACLDNSASPKSPIDILL